MSLDQVTLRFECLKLAISRSANNAEVLAKAKEYEAFVLEAQKEVVKELKPVTAKVVAGKKKSSGNSDILS